jgi:hypothetical protein
LGLADSIDRYHSAYSKLALSNDVRLLQNGPLQKLFETVRRFNVTD